MGLKAFAGTRKGNQTKLSIFLAPLVKDGFKVSVWIDGPWDNAAWKGRKLGEIEVPAGSASSISRVYIGCLFLCGWFEGQACYLFGG